MIPRYALIIGAMKAGTTTLFRGLEGHPQVAACVPKEPEYFLLDEQYRKGRAWYESLFRFDPARHAIALEGSTGFTKARFFPEGFARLREFEATADVRFLSMVRDPLARIESHVRHSMSRPGFRMPKDGRPSDAVVSVSEYATWLAPYAEAFGKDRVKVIALEDLRDRPREVLLDTCRFLGLRTDLEWEEPGQQNRGEDWMTFRSFWNPLLAPFPQRATTLRLMAMVRPGRPPSRLAPLFFAARPPQYKLPADVRAELRARLAPSTERLRREWGVDVSRWGF